MPCRLRKSWSGNIFKYFALIKTRALPGMSSTKTKAPAPLLKTFKLLLEYDGTRYSGWQVQKKRHSIQGVLQEALKRLTGEKIHVTASGRTDAGVHALAQVAHFKTSRHFKAEKIQEALNGILPDAVAVKAVEEVHPDFHAQMDATSKIYSYLILNDFTPYDYL